MNARLYDPEIGRFISADTCIDDPLNMQTFNRYSYVANNPLKYTDPTGYYTVKYRFRDRYYWDGGTFNNIGRDIARWAAAMNRDAARRKASIPSNNVSANQGFSSMSVIGTAYAGVVGGVSTRTIKSQGLLEGFSTSFEAIGDSLDYMTGGIFGDGQLDWGLQRRGNPLLLADRIGGTTKTLTYSAFGMATVATGVVSWAGGVEVLASRGFTSVGVEITKRHFAFVAFGKGTERYYSETLMRQLIVTGSRINTWVGPSIRDKIINFVTTIRYKKNGSEISINWIKNKIIHSRPK